MPSTTRKAIKGGRKFTNAQKKAVGRSVRKQRLARGDNPNTGKSYTAKQLGLKGGAKKTYRAQNQTGKRAMVKAAGRSGTRKTSRALNKAYKGASKGRINTKPLKGARRK